MKIINWNNWIDQLEEGMQACHFKSLTGIDCLGCGFQRSFIALLRGNWIESWLLYPPLGFQILLVLFTIAHLIFKFRWGAKWIKIWFIITTSCMVINYLIKMKNGQIF